jgi:hypothetical protein
MAFVNTAVRQTQDELNVRLLLAIEEKRAGSDGCQIAERMADIISTAAFQKSNLAWIEHCRRTWAGQSCIPYEPAITGGGFFGELFDWDIPDVMQRRAKLRSSQLIQDVLKHTLQ